MGLELEVLNQIRDESVKVRERVEKTNELIQAANERLDETNARLERVREELSLRIVESGARTTTAIAALACDVGALVTLLKQESALRTRDS